MQVKEIIGEYTRTQEEYRRLMVGIGLAMTKGLTLQRNKESNMLMLNTYIQTIPDGSGIYGVRGDSFSPLPMTNIFGHSNFKLKKLQLSSNYILIFFLPSTSIPP